jgi:hypothetical protein
VKDQAAFEELELEMVSSASESKQAERDRRGQQQSKHAVDGRKRKEHVLTDDGVMRSGQLKSERRSADFPSLPRDPSPTDRGRPFYWIELSARTTAHI